MKFLGIRCSNNDYTFAILSGKTSSPIFEDKGHVSFPKGFGRARSLKWFLQELNNLIIKNDVKSIGIKGTEPLAKKGNKFEIRAENEAIIFLAAAENGINHVAKKVNATIAKDLGLKGKGKYLKSKIDYSFYPNFDNENPKVKEAIQVAWSMIK